MKESLIFALLAVSLGGALAAEPVTRTDCESAGLASYVGKGWKLDLSMRHGAVWQIHCCGRQLYSSGAVQMYTIGANRQGVLFLREKTDACRLTASGKGETRQFRIVSCVPGPDKTNALAEVVRTFDCTPTGIRYEVALTMLRPYEPCWGTGIEYFFARYNDFAPGGVILRSPRRNVLVEVEDTYRPENWRVLSGRCYHSFEADAKWGRTGFRMENPTPGSGIQMSLHGKPDNASVEFQFVFPDPTGFQRGIDHVIAPGTRIATTIDWSPLASALFSSRDVAFAEKDPNIIYANAYQDEVSRGSVKGAFTVPGKGEVQFDDEGLGWKFL